MPAPRPPAGPSRGVRGQAILPQVTAERAVADAVIFDRRSPPRSYVVETSGRKSIFETASNEAKGAPWER